MWLDLQVALVDLVDTSEDGCDVRACSGGGIGASSKALVQLSIRLHGNAKLSAGLHERCRTLLIEFLVAGCGEFLACPWFPCDGAGGEFA